MHQCAGGGIEHPRGDPQLLADTLVTTASHPGCVPEGGCGNGVGVAGSVGCHDRYAVLSPEADGQCGTQGLGETVIFRVSGNVDKRRERHGGGQGSADQLVRGVPRHVREGEHRGTAGARLPRPTGAPGPPGPAGSPRWGASAGSSGMLWQEKFHRPAGSEADAQALDARVAYGQRLQVGAFGGERSDLFRIEVSGERASRLEGGADHRVRLLGTIGFGRAPKRAGGLPHSGASAGAASGVCGTVRGTTLDPEICPEVGQHPDQAQLPGRER